MCAASSCSCRRRVFALFSERGSVAQTPRALAEEGLEVPVRDGRGESHGVAPRLIANRADLDRIATEDDPDVPALSGWRRELFGTDALALRAGRLALTGSKRGVADVRLDE